MSTLLRRADLFVLGWTDALIRQLLAEPDEREPYKRGMYSTVRYWYSQERVNAAMESEAFQESQARRKRRAAIPEERMAGYSAHYPSWRAAITDVCHSMHSLNRYCKHGACSAENRTVIYDLKNQLVQLLYEREYCSACWEHILVLPPKKCRACYGSGDSGGCFRCDGTGNYLPEKRLRFYCFRFNVGRGYTWHQPDSLVKFPVQTTAPPAEWSGIEREKTLGIPRSKLAAAKDLIRWCLEKAKEPEPAMEFLEISIPPIVGEEQGSLFA